MSRHRIPESLAQAARARQKELATEPVGRVRPRKIVDGKKERRVKITARKEDGAKVRVTNLRRALIVKTGMLPLDFLTAVYRDELYDAYERKVTPDGKLIYFLPTREAKKIFVDMNQRIHAAVSAAPYVHRKMPQGIEVANKDQKAVTAAELRRLPMRDLNVLERLMDQLDGAPAGIKNAVRASRTYTQGGEEIKPEDLELEEPN